MSAVATIDTEQLKHQTDLIALAERHTTLSRESAREYSGPCPKGGHESTDSFHVTSEWFMCRKCHEKRGDAIEFVQWLHDVGFREACAMLSGGTLPEPATVSHRPAPTRPQRRPAGFDRGRAARLVADAQDRLFEAAGEPGQKYLLGRGLEPLTWLTFGLGYVASSPTAEKLPAIVLPWYQRGELVAVRFRFLKPAGDTKIKSLKGSGFAGRLFGGQALPQFVAQPVTEGHRPAEALRTLVLCEGELNAVSVWQVAAESGVDVLSVGSESQHTPESMVAIAARYGQVICWFDRPEIARSAAKSLPGAHAVQSPAGKDANDLLQAGLLSKALCTWRQRACETAEQRERLLWALWDAANSLQGVDAGTAQFCEGLAADLGKQMSLLEHRPGVWVTAQYAERLAESAGEFGGV